MSDSISIDTYDDSAMHTDPDYSPDMAGILGKCYGLNKRKRFQKALDLVLDHIGEPMSKAQRLRFYYLRALAEIGLEHVEDAEASLESLQSYAVELQALDALTNAAFRFGEVMRMQQYFSAALECFEGALDVLTEREDYNRLFALDLLALIAAQRFMLGMYSEAEDAVRQARETALQVPQASPAKTLALAKVDWTAALLCRWSGRLDEALGLAEHIYSALQVTGVRLQIGRINVVLADILLDKAMMFSQSTTLQGKYFETLSGVSQYLLDARTLAEEFHDLGCQGMALLATARLTRARNPKENVQPVLLRVKRIAVKASDFALLGQVYTAFGDEMLAHGKDEEAREWYNNALVVLRSLGAIALTTWPIRGLEALDRRGYSPEQI